MIDGGRDTWGVVAYARAYLAVRLDGTLTQMGWFFTKAAFFHFWCALYAGVALCLPGGRPAIFGWVNPGHMIDGWHSVETTPGR